MWDLKDWQRFTVMGGLADRNEADTLRMSLKVQGEDGKFYLLTLVISEDGSGWTLSHWAEAAMQVTRATAVAA